MEKSKLNIIIFVLIIGFGAFYFYKYAPQSKFFNKEPSKQENIQDKSEYGLEAPEKTTQAGISEQIEQAIIEKRGDYGGLEISVSEVVDDTYAKGGAMPEGGGPGGGMWFAKLVDGEWELVWDGNGAIYCSDLEGYEDFPSRLIPECYDENSMNTVTR